MNWEYKKTKPKKMYEVFKDDKYIGEVFAYSDKQAIHIIRERMKIEKESNENFVAFKIN